MPNERTIPANANASVVTFTVKINGEDIDPTIKVSSISVSREVNRIATAKVAVIDGSASEEDFLTNNTELFIPGNSIELFAGHQSEEDLVFKGVIVKQSVHIREEGNSIIKLDCRHEAFKMTIGKQNQYFVDLSDSEVFEETLNEYGITPKVEATSIVHDKLVQYHATDWDFILTRADVNGKIVITEDDGVNIAAPNAGADSVLDLHYGATIFAFDAEIDARHQYKKVAAFAWDDNQQELVESEATEPTVPDTGNLTGDQLSDAHGLETFRLQHSGQVLDEERQAWADAQLLKSRLAKVQGRVTTKGYAGVLPGQIITLNGVGDRYNGKAFVSGVQHQIKEGDWKTTFQIGLSSSWFAADFKLNGQDSLFLIPGIKGLMIGVVTSLEGDPDGAFRIQVKIPVLDNEEEGIWARMASLDAGNNRGMVFRPEIGDEVVVGFLNEDPRDPIVLGMLHSSTNVAPIDNSDDNHQKGYTSRSEMKFHFDDEKKSVTLETPAGKKIIVDEDANSINIEDDNNNKIILDSNGITIESGKDILIKASGKIEQESSTAFNIKAGTQLKAEGQAGAELSSGATAVIKGSLVQIN